MEKRETMRLLIIISWLATVVIALYGYSQRVASIVRGVEYESTLVLYALGITLILTWLGRKSL